MNNKYHAVIIDDEVNGAKSLQALVSVCCPQLEVIRLVHSPIEAITVIKEAKPDLIFLDIEMPEMSGFELLEQLGKIDFEVVFVTAYAEFALKAFKTNAMSYLLKPVDSDDLIVAYNKFLELEDSQLSQRLDKLENMLHEIRSGQAITRLTVSTHDGIIYLETSKIIRLEADSNYTHIYLLGGKKITSSKTMKEYEDVLPIHEFIRIHNAHIVNTRFVERYIRGEGGYIITSDNSTLEVSRRRKGDLLAMLNNHK